MVESFDKNKPHPIYLHHVGGNYGSPLYKCSACGGTGLSDDWTLTGPMEDIKHTAVCPYRLER